MVFEKSWWSCVALIMSIAGCSSPGKVTSSAPTAPELTATSSQALTSSNGVWQNGLTTNGVWQNGVWQNGVWQNGVWQNGVWQNGVWQNGVWQNGVWQNGVWQNGVWQNGVWQNGVWQNGVWQNGVWQNGVFQNGAWQNGVWQNGVWQNGVWQNGVWQNGVWQNGFANTALVTSMYTRQVLQYIYACAMPGTLSSDGVTGLYDTIIDPANPNHTCGDGGTCDAPYTCSSTGFCVIPCASNHTCDPGYTCTVLNTCVVPLKGAIGLGINADGTHWWDRGTGGDGGAGEAGVGDAGTSEAGQCDESCQRWVSACLLARTNAYGVHVDISMRAPANAPQAIKDALAVSNVERNGDDAGTAGYTLREGAYYGNIFGTTPVNPAPATYSGPATGPVASAPTLTACAGPGSNIPEITKRFCSSQGDQVVINVPGVCLGTSTELGTCAGEDGDPTSATFGAIQDCHRSASATPTPCADYRDPNCFSEVITVYLKEPIAVCGNGVCEPPTETSASCQSDCHPGDWAKDFSSAVTSTVGATVAPDDTVVVGATAQADVDLGGGVLSAALGAGVLVKYATDGHHLWSTRFGGTSQSASTGQLQRVTSVAIAPNGNISVVGSGLQSVASDGGQAVQNQTIWLGTFGADGTQLGASTVASAASGSYVTPEGPAALDSAGNVLLAGACNGSVLFGSTPCPSGANDAFLAKVTPQGALVWIEPFSVFQVNGDSLLTLFVDRHPVGGVPADNIVIVLNGTEGVYALQHLCADGSLGTCPDGSNAQPGADNPGADNVGVECFNQATATWTSLPSASCSNGSTAWLRTIHQFNVATADTSGNIYVSGNAPLGFENYGAGIVNPTYNVPLTVKYGPDGSYKWLNYSAKSVCGLPSCYQPGVGGMVIGFDTAGNAIVASFGDPAIGGGIDFGTGILPTYSTSNIFITSYDPLGGSVQWAKQIPMILSSSISGMSLDSKGRVIVSGGYGGSMQVDGQLLVTAVPEDPNRVDSFVASFGGPSPLDKTPPTIGAGFGPTGSVVDTVPNNIVVQATSAAGAVVFYMPPTAIDNGDPGGNPPGTSVYCSPVPNGPFPLGTTTVRCTASDPFGHSSSASFTVTVVDTIGPVFSQVADITLQATSASGVTVTYTAPTATDQVDGNRPVTCSGLASGSVFPIGKTTVTCSASDNSNNQSQTTFVVTVVAPAPTVTCGGAPGSPAVVSTSPGVCGIALSNGGIAGTCSGGAGGLASCTFDGASSEILGPGDHSVAVVGSAAGGATANCTSYVRVVDNEKPVVTCAAQQVECTGNGGATVAPSATCADNCSCTDNCATAFFRVGTSQGSCTATDPSGNSSGCQASITVVDSKPPAVTPRPGPSQLQCGVDTWTDPGATAIDACVGDLSSSVHASGIVDPLHVGTYAVTYSATDPSGNVGSATRTVAVIDTLAPALTLPGTLTAIATSASGATVSYSASATDRCDGAIIPSCTPASGSTFAPGASTVTCNATDAHGNKATGTFQVLVQYAWSGILQPINSDGSSIFKLGRTVPVKFQLTGASARISNAVATLSVAKVSSNITGTYVEAVSTSAATTGNTFRYDSTSGQYIFNLSTSNLSTGTWQLLIDLHDGVARTVVISLR
jgi:hypothetical protein